jgi:hypothetical protein
MKHVIAQYDNQGVILHNLAFPLNLYAKSGVKNCLAIVVDLEEEPLSATSALLKFFRSRAPLTDLIFLGATENATKSVLAQVDKFGWSRPKFNVFIIQNSGINLRAFWANFLEFFFSYLLAKGQTICCLILFVLLA